MLVYYLSDTRVLLDSVDSPFDLIKIYLTCSLTYSDINTDWELALWMNLVVLNVSIE